VRDVVARDVPAKPKRSLARPGRLISETLSRSPIGGGRNASTRTRFI
jgi:hypothetical protein